VRGIRDDADAVRRGEAGASLLLAEINARAHQAIRYGRSQNAGPRRAVEADEPQVETRLHQSQFETETH
jgi:hypothetical protein